MLSLHTTTFCGYKSANYIFATLKATAEGSNQLEKLEAAKAA